MIKRLVSCVLLLACILLPAGPAMAGNTATKVTGTVPLIIYNVQVSGITSCKATVSWQTNGSASSQVFYDKFFHTNITDYPHHSNLDNTLVVTHTVLLTGLSPATLYHFRVKSVDVIDGDVFTAVSPDSTFTTPGIAPCVMTIWALPVGTNCAVLWGCLNSRGSASAVEVYFQYGKTAAYGSVTSHQTVTCDLRVFCALVNNLIPDTTYHFQAVAVGSGTSYGDDKVFRTLPQPVITVVTPNGGEKWAPGSRQTIKWTYANVCGDVKIELLKGNAVNRVICSATSKGSNGTGSYSWTIPSSQTIGDYKIRVTSVCETSCTDTSNNVFSITNH